MNALVMPFPPARLFVRGREPEERTTPLARWLTEARLARGWSMRDLEAKADVSQARISQIESGGDAPVKMLERLAQALVPEGLDAEEAEESYRRLREQAIRAAFLHDETSREMVYEPAAERIAEAYKGATEEGRRMLEIAAEAVERAFSRDSIGKRVRDDD